MLATTQWPLERASHLTSLWVCVLWLPESLMDLSALCWRDKKDSATNEKWWHHFRILIADKWSVVWNECKNREFLLTGWKSLWSLATWLVISDRYIGEVILQLSIEAMASHSNSTKPLPQLRTEYILLITSSSTTHYVCFLSGDRDLGQHWFR